ncbi:hypothetical protein QQZ08_006423 [Neonectria magnoliae]|uniref:Uncharacterized protein n=1 Tax=Neonectria magnoliae TaxID=2732573 RepID=A0ABR1I101_9HYPO
MSNNTQPQQIDQELIDQQQIEDTELLRPVHMFNQGIDMDSDQNEIGDQFQSSYPYLDAMPVSQSPSFDDFFMPDSASNDDLVVPGDSEATASFINAHLSAGLETTSAEPEPLPEWTIDPALIANSPMETEAQEEQQPEEHLAPEQGHLESLEDIDLIPASLRLAMKDKGLEFRGFITSKSQGAALRNVYNSLGAKPLGVASRPETDPTFPQNDEEYRGRIRQMFEAISDWTDRRDWRARMSRKDVVAWLAEMTSTRQQNDQDADLSKVCDADMIPPAGRMPSLLEQWKNVTGREVSTFEIELLCAEVLLKPRQNQAELAQKGENHIPLWSNHEAHREEYPTFEER